MAENAPKPAWRPLPEVNRGCPRADGTSVSDGYRVYYNFVKMGQAKEGREKGEKMPPATPVMRLGLARGRNLMEGILYFGRWTGAA